MQSAQTFVSHLIVKRRKSLEVITPKVYLIGGAPGAGKSTLGAALATRLGIPSLTIDDLNIAAQAITTPETHPNLHVMRKLPSLEYFINSSIEQLKADATAQHKAIWPMVEQVVRKHAKSSSPIVIDGWYMRPSWVAQLKLENVWSGWIVASPEVLKEREKNISWYQESADPDQMLENFLGRSLWFNDLVREQAIKHHLTILFQPGDKSVDQLCNLVLEQSGG